MTRRPTAPGCCPLGASRAGLPLVALALLAALPPARAQVVITGSSIRQIEASGALPVQTLTRADIERTGVQTVEQLLRTIPAMSSSSQIQTASSVGLSAWGAADVSLRGLGAERTLVLVNGQRVAPFAGGGGTSVNVNNLPLAAIERVEILKDGASAVYGSDAIAGVVNFILKSDFQGVAVNGTYGTPTAAGGGQQVQAGLVAGFGDRSTDGYNLTGSLQWSRNRDLLGADRAYAKTATRLPYYAAFATSQGDIQGAWAPGVNGVSTGQGITVGGLPYLGAWGMGYGNPMAAPTDRCAAINMVPMPLPQPGDPPSCSFDQAPYVGLLGASDNLSATLNGNLRLGAQAELYGDLLWSRTLTTLAYQASPLRSEFMEPDAQFDQQLVDRVLLIRPTNPNYPVAADHLNANGYGALVGQPLGVTARVFDFGRRVEQNTSEQLRLWGGARGVVAQQAYDLGAFWNQNRLNAEVSSGYFSQVGFARVTQDPTLDWNPWSLTQSPAVQAAIAGTRYAGPTLDARSRSYGLQATLTGDLSALPAGALQYAAGAQYRDERLHTDPAPAMLSGDIAGLGGSIVPLDAGRRVFALFGELNAPLAKGLDLGAALRWDDYSDFGSTTNWKANLRWQPLPQLMLRGSYGTGFRAPTLTDLHYPVTFGTSAQFNDPVTGQTALQVNEWSGGNPNLQPETSRQFALGLMLQPSKAFAFGIDYFQLEVDDVIAQPSTQEVVAQAAAGNPAFVPLVVRDPLTNAIVSTRTQLLNSGVIRIAGLDLSASYRRPIGPGLLSLGLQGTYYTQYEQTSAAGVTTSKIGTTVDAQGNPVPSATAGLDGYGVVLRYKQYAAVTWQQGDWATTVGNSYATGYHAGWNLFGEPTRIGAMSLWDLIVAYSGLKNTVLTIGVRNLFDTQPDPYVPVSNAFQSGYDPSQYDPRGRFVFVTASVRF